MDELVALTVRCLCKAHVFTTSVPRSALPLEAFSCHCSSCRRQSGSLYSSSIPWPTASVDLSQLKRYSRSKDFDLFSCGTCSTILFSRGTGPDAKQQPPWATTGALANSPGLARYACHIFLDDTIDGGAGLWLPGDDEEHSVLRFKGQYDESDQVPSAWPEAKTSATAADTMSTVSTPFSCHCKGIHFSLRSPRHAQGGPGNNLPSAEYSALPRYRATVDTSDYCRVTMGTELTFWAHVPLSDVGFGGQPCSFEFPGSITALRDCVTSTNKDKRFGTLKVYDTFNSSDIFFCGECAASVFLAVKDQPDTVKIAVGLLDHPGGARAESLLSWNYADVEHKGDAEGDWREYVVDAAKQRGRAWATQSV